MSRRVEFSIEISPEKNPIDPQKLRSAKTVAVTCLPLRGVGATVDLSLELANAGIKVKPHLAARQLNHSQLSSALASFKATGIDQLMVIGGDNDHPQGDFDNSSELIEAIQENDFRVDLISLAGHPEGAHHITREEGIEILLTKQQQLARFGWPGEVITQFGFSFDNQIDWVRESRRMGLTLPILIGLPGPTNAFKLMGFASRLGVDATHLALQHPGEAMRLAFYNPTLDLERWLTQSDFDQLGIKGFQVFTFNQYEDSAKWIQDIRRDYEIE